MAKNALKKAAKYFDFVAIVLAVVAICMIFVGAVTPYTEFEGHSTTGETISGLKAVFGYTETYEGWGDTVTKQEILKFSFMNLLPYILLVAGVVVLVLNILGKGGKFANVIAAACFGVAGVLLFFTGAFVVPVESIKDQMEAMQEMGGSFVFKLAAGPIIGGVMSLLACATNVGKIFSK